MSERTDPKTVGEFNETFSATMHVVRNTGAAQDITRHGREWVSLIRTDLLRDLLAAAGPAGTEVLERYRADGKKQETAA